MICLECVLRTEIDPIKENGFSLNLQERDDLSLKLSLMQTSQMFWSFLIINLLEPNVCYITWNRQQDALTYTVTKTKELTCFKEKTSISTLNVKSLKLVDHFPYIGSNVSSTESKVAFERHRLLLTVSR